MSVVDAPELASFLNPWPFGRPISENQLERIFQAKQAEIHQNVSLRNNKENSRLKNYSHISF